MMCKPTKGITELEDILRLDAGVTINELLRSPLLAREARAVAEGLALDLEAGVVTGDETVESLLQKDVLCSCCGQEKPCLKEGGSLCPPCREKTAAIRYWAVNGGAISCMSACPIGVDIPGIMQLMREGSLLEARRTLMKYLPMAQTGLPCLRQMRVQLCPPWGGVWGSSPSGDSLAGGDHQ